GHFSTPMATELVAAPPRARTPYVLGAIGVVAATAAIVFAARLPPSAAARPAMPTASVAREAAMPAPTVKRARPAAEEEPAPAAPRETTRAPPGPPGGPGERGGPPREGPPPRRRAPSLRGVSPAASTP